MLRIAYNYTNRLAPESRVAADLFPAGASRRPERSPTPRLRLGGFLGTVGANFTGFLIADQTDGKRSLDLRYGAAFRARAEGGCDSASAGAAGTPHAVDELFGNLRQ